MARCGRCGLFYRYPDDFEEKQYSGACLWFQFRLVEDEVFEKRECSEFVEKIPGLSELDHFEMKVKRTDLRSGYLDEIVSRRIAYVALVISIAGTLWNLLKDLYR